MENLNGLYEIVIYTAEQGMTVFPIIEALDPKNIISYKLVRDATHFVDGHHVKNLERLNRDLKRVIVVDWNTESVKFNPENLFHIDRWNGTDDDTTLVDLAAFLKSINFDLICCDVFKLIWWISAIAQSEVDDVRDVLKYYAEFENPLAVFREKQKKLMEQQEAEREAKLTTKKRWTPSFLNKSF